MEEFESVDDSSNDEIQVERKVNFKVSDFKKIVSTNIKKYNCTVEQYDKNQVDNIIYDEKKKIVSVFKDSLLWNEPTGLLRR